MLTTAIHTKNAQNIYVDDIDIVDIVDIQADFRFQNDLVKCFKTFGELSVVAPPSAVKSVPIHTYVGAPTGEPALYGRSVSSFANTLPIVKKSFHQIFPSPIESSPAGRF